MTTSLRATIPVLCQANLGLLKQKAMLVNAMNTQFGEREAKILFQKVCPIVKASIGQHFRHSIDHMEFAVQAALASNAIKMDTNYLEIHYDLRQRGSPDEYDIDRAVARIQKVIEGFTQLSSLTGLEEDTKEVSACFMLSEDTQEFVLPSTLERELGFCAHHAIHHMALTKIIAVETIQFPPDALPEDFGKAPSTIVFDKRQE